MLGRVGHLRKVFCRDLSSQARLVALAARSAGPISRSIQKTSVVSKSSCHPRNTYTHVSADTVRTLSTRSALGVRRYASLAPSKADEVYALEKLSSAANTEKYLQRTTSMTSEARLARALSRTEDLMLFFISMCKGDEQFMQVRSFIVHTQQALTRLSQRFDTEKNVPENSEMARARSATAQMLKSIAWDVSHVSNSHPLRTEDNVFDLQISDFVEVIDKYLAGTSSSQMPSTRSPPFRRSSFGLAGFLGRGLPYLPWPGLDPHEDFGERCIGSQMSD
jgi:hypothetical protein